MSLSHTRAKGHGEAKGGLEKPRVVYITRAGMHPYGLFGTTKYSLLLPCPFLPWNIPYVWGILSLHLQVAGQRAMKEELS